MSMTAFMTDGVRAAAEAAAAELMTVRHKGGSGFISLPMSYPSGSFVTVKIDMAPLGFRVSDNGFAYREAETLGAQRSFAKTAGKAAESEDVFAGKRVIFVDVVPSELVRAIIDVAKVSWTVANKIIERASEEAEAELAEHLTERLVSLFGEKHVKAGSDTTAVGASTNAWEVSAIVDLDGRRAVFQAVANHANSIYRTSTAFRDLGALDHPPKLVSVVHSKSELGSKLALLAQAGSVIEEGQSDQVFRRAAA